MRRSREKAKPQRCRASPLDDDDDDEEKDTEDDEEDLEVLQRIPDIFQQSGDGAGSSGAGHTVSAVDKDGVMRKCLALSSPRGPSPKRSHAINDGCQSSFVTTRDPSQPKQTFSDIVVSTEIHVASRKVDSQPLLIHPAKRKRTSTWTGVRPVALINTNHISRTHMGAIQ